MSTENKKIKEMDPQEIRFHRRKDIIKNIAIIFLVIMLILTFFSNTIMNYSLPQVAVQYTQSGSITSAIRGTGTVESGDPYNVMVKETRVVSSISVREDQEVNQGDVLISLAEGDSTELTNAKEVLEAAQNAYTTALISADVTSTEISSAQTTPNVTSYRAQITAAQNELETAEKALATAKANEETAQALVDKLEAQAESTSSTGSTDTSAETAAVNAAKSALDAAEAAKTTAENEELVAENKVSELTNKQDYYDTVGYPVTNEYLLDDEGNVKLDDSGDPIPNPDYFSHDTIQAEIDAANLNKLSKTEALNTATANYNTALANYNTAQTALTNKQNSASSSQSAAINSQLAAAKTQLANAKAATTTAQTNYDDKNEALTELVSSINTVLNLNSLYNAIIEAQANVDSLTASTGAVDVTAPISGTVISVNVTSGKTTDPSEAVVVIRPSDQGYYMSFSISSDDAKMVSVGDPAEVTDSWWYSGVTGTVSSIKPDKTSPKDKKTVTLSLEGDLTEGQSLSMTISTRTVNYDCIVPNSAVHEDNNGKFVLVCESKSSPLGNRYFAVRYDVEVLAKDDSQSAVKGGLSGYEYVITTSSKPISAGDQVRLSES